MSSVESGYIGGADPNPTYEQVCGGRTGHAEAVRITYDSQVISYEDILGIFFATHDPTTLNRQGGDVGTQYRSAIFAHGDSQRVTAERVIAELNDAHIWEAPIVTTIESDGPFYKAEPYHQDFFRRNPGQGYCLAVVAPKVVKFRRQFAQRLKSA